MGTRHLILIWYKGKWQIVQYGQWGKFIPYQINRLLSLSIEDGYPSGQGIKIVKFLTNRPHDYENEHLLSDDKVGPAKDQVGALKAALDNGMVYQPTEEQISAWYEQAARAKKEIDQQLDEPIHEKGKQPKRSEDEWRRLQRLSSAPLMAIQPSIARDCGAQILNIIAEAQEPVPVVKDEYFGDGDLYSPIEWSYVIDLDQDLLEIYSGSVTKGEEPEWMPPNGQGRFDESTAYKDADCRPLLIADFTFAELAKLNLSSQQLEDMADGRCGFER
jgi:hypothetical protein